MIKLTVEGVVYEFENDRLLLAEARELKTFTRMTPRMWAEGVEDGDPDATQYLIYLAKKRVGETLRFSDLDTLDYADLELEFIEPEPDSAEAGEGGSDGGGTGAGPYDAVRHWDDPDARYYAYLGPFAYNFKYTPGAINALTLSEFDILAVVCDELAKDPPPPID